MSDVHIPVLCKEVIEGLLTRRDGTYVDATMGRGGHTQALLAELGPTGRVLGIDRDPDALIACRARFAGESRVTLFHATFRDLPEIVRGAGGTADGLMADLGLSSPQIDAPSRGFSFRMSGPLDMRADPTQGETALELIDRLDDSELADVLYEYGEERASRRIARVLKARLRDGRLQTTDDLRQAVHSAIGSRPRGGIDSATRTFQGLRIAVNDELGELDALLAALPTLLCPGGRAAIISYHSLEDRKVKHSLRSSPDMEPLTKRPIVAGEVEQASNPRSRSAKLRLGMRREET